MTHLEVKTTANGEILARRTDRLPLTQEDREEARRLAELEGVLPPRAWIVEQVQGENGELRAVKLCSAMLEDRLWLILDRSLIPHDGLACYYAEEIPLLGTKTPEELKMIHKAKLAFPGSRVIQEGAEK